MLELWINIIYHGMCNHSKDRGHPKPSFTKQELLEYALQNNVIEKIIEHLQDGSKGSMPSFDRINPKLPYSLDNIELVTWAENQQRNADQRSHPVIAIDEYGNETKFKCIRDAAKAVNRDKQNIRRVLKTGGKCAKLFWRYA